MGPTMIEQPPEIADGGYWYVVKAESNAETGAIEPGSVPGVGWCAWYAEINGVVYAAVRTPKPVTGLNTVDVSVADVLAQSGYSVKPFGRIKGA